MNLLNNKRGFTLVEMLIVIAIFTIIMSIVLLTFITYNKKSKAEKNILIMDEDLKSAIYILTNIIQMGGYGTKYSLLYENKNVNGFNRVFTPVDSDSDGSDSLTVVYANRFIGYIIDDNVSNNSICYKSNNIYIKVSSTSNINLLDSNYKKYVFVDRAPFNEFFELLSEPESSSISTCPSGFYCYKLSFSNQLNVCDNDSVYSVRAVTISYDLNNYEIEISENIGDNPIPIISNIETIQFQYGIDRNNDGNFDDIDNDGNPLDNTFSKNDEKYLKLVKVSILIRAKDPDPDYRSNQTIYQVANKTIQLDTDDTNGINSKYDWHYRRKLIELNVVPRNMLTEF